MGIKKVYIDMDQMWVWFTPGEAGCYAPQSYDEKPKTVTLSEEWLAELEQTRKRYFTAQSVLEHLYRVQEGLKPYTLSEEETKELERAQGKI